MGASAAAGTLIKTCGVGEHIVSVPASSTTITLDAGTYDFKFEVTSVDGQANSGFFQMGISAGTCIATAVKNDGSTDAQTSTEPRQQRRSSSAEPSAEPTSAGTTGTTTTSAEPSMEPSSEPSSEEADTVPGMPTDTYEPTSALTAAANAPMTDAPTDAEETVIVATFEVAGDVEDFDEDAFIVGLAVLLGVESWQITIVSVQRRSITVVTNVVAETEDQASLIEVSLSEVTELDEIGGATVLGAVTTECTGSLCTTNAPTTAATSEQETLPDTGNPASKVQASNMSTLFVALLVIMIISC